MPKSYISTSSEHRFGEEEDVFILECEASYLSVLPNTNTPIDSKKQLKKALQQAGRNPSEKQTNEIWDSHSGAIQYKEYCAIIRKLKPPSRDDLLSAFKALDLNNDGFISHSELYKVLTSQGEKMTNEEVEKIITSADVNRDGRLDYPEFCTLMLSTSQQCKQNNVKRLRALKTGKKTPSSSRPASASSRRSTTVTPRPMPRMVSRDEDSDNEVVIVSTSPKKGTKASSRPTSAARSLIVEGKLDNLVKIKKPPLPSKKSGSVAPKSFKTWNHTKSKGCFYIDSDDGSILCHHYDLELATASKVWLTMKPYYLSQNQDAPPNAVDMSLMIFRRSPSQRGQSEFIGVTNLKENSEYCWKGDLRGGTYSLVPFTSGCRLFRRRNEPDEAIQLIRKDQNNEVQLSRAFKETLSDMFEMCDLDGNGLLNREEFNWFQLLTSDEEVDDEAWNIVQENFQMKKDELTREGFEELHLMQAKEENSEPAEELMDTVMCMGYNKALDMDQACPFEINVYMADCKPVLSVEKLSLAHQYPETTEMVITAIMQLGEKQQLKSLPGLEWYVYHDESRISMVLANNSQGTIEIRVDCSKMKNCVSTRRRSNYILQLVPNSRILVDHVQAEDEKKEWHFQCSLAKHDPTSASTHSLKSASSRPQSAARKGSSASLFK